MMKSFPLTFAVFFQSILSPNMSVTNHLSKDILFCQEFPLPPDGAESISPGTYSDYTRGKRPVRAESIRQLCHMQPEELAPRMALLGLQDTSFLRASIKNLLTLCEISPQLRQELQAQSHALQNTELFLAKLFQLSLKCDNRKQPLDKEDIAFLNGIGSMDFPSDLEAETEASGDAGPIASADAKPTAPAYTSDKILRIAKDDIRSIPLSSVIQENNELLEKYGIKDLDAKPFHGFKISLQDVRLPEDFQAFWAYTIQFITDLTFTRLSVDDVIRACALDMEHKTCRNGTLKILEVSCTPNQMETLRESLENIDLNHCTDCLFTITGSYSLETANNICTIFQDILGTSVNITFGMDLDEHTTHHQIRICAIFQLKKDTLPKRPTFFTAPSFSAQKPPTRSNGEIKVPDFLKKPRNT